MVAAHSGSTFSLSTPPRPSFAKPQKYATADFTGAVAIGDLNGDGKKDLVTASTPSPRAPSVVSVLLNRGGGRFGAARRYRAGVDSEPVAIGDLNGDGQLDVATADGEAVSVLINDGDGRLRPARSYAAAKYPWDIAIGDLNGDGNADLATANTDIPLGGSGSSVSVFINKGDGTFEDRVDYEARRHPFSVAIADLNQDGKQDLAVANFSDAVSVLMNSGDAGLRPRTDYRAGSGPRSIAIGDLNGDRLPDLVTANSNSSPEGGRAESVSVLLNTGVGSFRRERDFRTRGQADPSFSSVAIGDLNRDGKRDVAVGDDRRTVSVLLNSSGGRLKKRIDYSTRPPTANSLGVRSVAIGELNGDGKPDLVTLKRASVLVFLNTTRR